MNKYSTERGFSLVELSVVITILSIMAATGLKFFGRSLEFDRLETTKSRQEFILQALEQYVHNFGHMPCPASLAVPTTDAGFGIGTGSGNPIASPCTTTNDSAGDGIVAGAIPTATLGIPPEYTFDGWNHRFTYVMSQNMAYVGDGTSGFSDTRTTTKTTSVGFTSPKSPVIYSSQASLYAIFRASITSGVTGPFSFTRRATAQEAIDHDLKGCNGSTSYSIGHCIPLPSAFAIISHGKNGFGAFRYQGTQITSITGTPGTYEIRNSVNGSGSDFNTIYMLPQNRGATVAADYFDDIIISRTKAQLQNLE